MENSIIKEANYLLDNQTTIRKTANYFKVSKSKVHSDFKYKLRKIDCDLFKKVTKLLNNNFNKKHIIGGEVTKNKFKKIK